MQHFPLLQRQTEKMYVDKTSGFLFLLQPLTSNLLYINSLSRTFVYRWCVRTRESGNNCGRQLSALAFLHNQVSDGCEITLIMQAAIFSQQ